MKNWNKSLSSWKHRGPLHGLPLSFQLVGFPFAEAKLLNIAHAYQGLTDFHLREPTL
jgi:Asp-tRNA(Asn)/Glu-tRNA(Gln) amidotransferase A subunit family amidase